MKKLISKKKVTAVLFLLFIFIYAGINARKELPILKETVKTSIEEGDDPAGVISSLDASINENVKYRYNFIDVYGLIQKFLDKNEENDFEVVKDTEGKLHYTYFTEKPNETAELSKRMENLNDSIKKSGCRLIYAMPPDKYIEGHTRYAKGIPYNMANETADQFLSELDDAGIDSVDFRDYLADSGLEMSEVFFNTDHHWKIETAFWATNVFFEQLKERYGEEIPNEDFYEDRENYNFLTYKNCFLGSQGRKAGRYYTEADDFTLIYPKFETNYVLDSSIMPGMSLTGRFEEALLATPVLRDTAKPYDTDLYMAYMYGNQAFAHIEYEENPDGPDICIIKDSYAVPFATFASLRCHNVYMIDPRYYEDSIEDFINSKNMDYVVVMFSPDDLAEDFFTFGESK